ncbi:MAG: flagellar hook-associated protein FlgK [Armatimonadetes bacterium]|jgi:flagellar hook-associated protein 1 FlgK|nr:flagellar hook-associated protein FlgK [Armatimonadota bacterium]
MAGTFFGINVAASGLAAQRAAMEILSQNIAHASDPAYKRQRLVLSEGLPLAQSQQANYAGSSIIGSGVQIGAVQRVRDALIERRLLLTGQSCAQYDFMTKTLQQLEAAIGEPNDTGFQNDLDQFWAAWSKVASTPDSISIRAALLDDAQAMCSRIQYIHQQMRASIDDMNIAASAGVVQINQITQDIARINREIAVLPTGTLESNGLMNRRDSLVQQLSNLASVSQFGEDGGSFVLTLGGRVLVHGTHANELTTAVDSNGNRVVMWANDGEAVKIQGGEIKALYEVRDSVIPGYMDQLDKMVATLVEQVNALHRTGKTIAGEDGGDFFRADSTAVNISLDSSILDQPRLVAASSVSDGQDSEVAWAIADLKNWIDPTSGLTINGLYRELVGTIGSDTATAEKTATAHQLSYQQFLTQQQSISGVSLDEEMTNMIKFQQSYNASSRVLSVMDEMLSTLIERTGTVGR